MSRHALRRRGIALLRLDLSGVELLVGTISILWALCLLSQPHIFTLDAYQGFRALPMSAPRLGSIMCPVGLSLISSLVSGFVHWRRLSLIASTAFWSFMGAIFLMSPVIGVSPFLAGLLAVHSVLALLSLRISPLPIRNG